MEKLLILVALWQFDTRNLRKTFWSSRIWGHQVRKSHINFKSNLLKNMLQQQTWTSNEKLLFIFFIISTMNGNFIARDSPGCIGVTIYAVAIFDPMISSAMEFKSSSVTRLMWPFLVFETEKLIFFFKLNIHMLFGARKLLAFSILIEDCYRCCRKRIGNLFETCFETWFGNIFFSNNPMISKCRN